MSYEDVKEKNPIGGNSGNMLFSDSVWRTLARDDTHIVGGRLHARNLNADQINQKFDHFVIPFANAFRPDFIKKHLWQYTDVIEKLNIPVTIVGIGSQSSLEDRNNLSDFDEESRRFVRAVLRRGPAIGVRGELTYDYLKRLGFGDSDIQIIGCPSVFYHGATPPKIEKADALSPSSRISMNVSPGVPGIEEMFERNFAHYHNLFYVPQQIASLDQILWNGAHVPKRSTVFPASTDHPVFQQDRIRYFINSTTWMNALQGCDFVFGTRIHGNIAALLAGTPAFVLAHDSRTLELARYFEIPHIQWSETLSTKLAEELFSRSDYKGYMENHGERFARYVRFIEDAGLPHVYGEGGDKGEAFDRRIRETPFSRPMPSPQHQTPQHLVARMAWTRQQSASQVSKIQEEMTLKLAQVKRELQKEPEVRRKETQYRGGLQNRIFQKLRRHLEMRQADKP